MSWHIWENMQKHLTKRIWRNIVMQTVLQARWMLILRTANLALTRTVKFSKSFRFFSVKAIQVETGIAAFKRKLSVQIWLTEQWPVYKAKKQSVFIWTQPSGFKTIIMKLLHIYSAFTFSHYGKVLIFLFLNPLKMHTNMTRSFHLPAIRDKVRVSEFYSNFYCLVIT